MNIYPPIQSNELITRLLKEKKEKKNISTKCNMES